MKNKFLFIDESGTVREFFSKEHIDYQVRLKLESSAFQKKNAQNFSSISEDNKLYTLQRTANIFNISRPTIYAWIDKNILNPINIGGRVYFDPEEIDLLIKSKGK